MAIHVDTRYRLVNEILVGLFAEKGFPIGSYELFLVSGEGTDLPISTPEQIVERTSGYLVDRQGRHFNFWLDWIDEVGAPGFSIWEEADVEAIWSQEDEYLEARRAVGLPELV